MKITAVFLGDRLLLQVVVLVDTTNFCSYEGTKETFYVRNFFFPKNRAVYMIMWENMV